MFSVFDFLDRQFTTPLQNFISSGTSGISAWVTAPLTVALTLYVILYGFLILRGSVQEPIMDFAFRAMKLAIIVMLVRNAGGYQAYVTDIFFETLPKEVSEALNTGGAPSATTFDSLLDKGQKSANDIWAHSAWPVDPLISLAGLVVVFVTFVVASIGYVVSLYARVALAIILAIGPVFIALAMFHSTRRFTEAWIAQLANFVILQVLVVAIGSLLVTSFATMFTTIEDYKDVLMRPIAVGAIGLASLYVFYQLPSIASALASGGASLTYGYAAGRDAHQSTITRTMGWSLRRLTGRGA